MAKKRKPDEIQDDGHITREFFNNPNGTFSINVKCSKCGKPITVVNKFGMFCENLCGQEESKKALNKLRKIFGGLFDNFIPPDINDQ